MRVFDDKEVCVLVMAIPVLVLPLVNVGDPVELEERDVERELIDVVEKDAVVMLVEGELDRRSVVDD